MAAHRGSICGSWTWRPLIGFGLAMTATAPSSRTARRASAIAPGTSWNATWAANFRRDGSCWQ